MTSCGFLVNDSGTGVNLLNVTADGANSQALILLDYESLTWSNQNYGSVLVRSTVPWPAAASLFGSALGLLGWSRRKTS